MIFFFLLSGDEGRSDTYRDRRAPHNTNNGSFIEHWSREQLEIFLGFLHQGANLNIGEKWAWQKVVNPQEIQTYPPPSLYALLSAYLRPDVDDGTKHRLVQYVSMDLTWIFGSRTNFGNILQHLVTFPSTYSLKPSMMSHGE
jgi:hypothetical protein